MDGCLSLLSVCLPVCLSLALIHSSVGRSVRELLITHSLYACRIICATTTWTSGGDCSAATMWTR